jgi:hypothetical protein
MVAIKKNNRFTRRNDKYLCGENPLPCVVTITGNHNHRTTSADAMRCLRSGQELQVNKQIYYVYK